MGASLATPAKLIATGASGKFNFFFSTSVSSATSIKFNWAIVFAISSILGDALECPSGCGTAKFSKGAVLLMCLECELQYMMCIN